MSLTVRNTSLKSLSFSPVKPSQDWPQDCVSVRRTRIGMRLASQGTGSLFSCQFSPSLPLLHDWSCSCSWRSTATAAAPLAFHTRPAPRRAAPSAAGTAPEGSLRLGTAQTEKRRTHRRHEKRLVIKPILGAGVAPVYPLGHNPTGHTALTW